MTRHDRYASSRFPALTPGINVFVAAESFDAASAPDVLTRVALADMLGQIRSACGEGGTDADLFGASLYARAPSRFRLLHGMAAHCDAHIAQVAQAAGYEPHRIGPDQVDEMNAQQGMHDNYVLAHADLVILIWDGGDASADARRILALLHQAARQLMPVLWIDADGTVRELLPARINKSVLHQLDNGIVSTSLLRGEDGIFSATVSPVSVSLRWWINPLAAAAAQYRSVRGSDAGPLHALRAYAEERDTDNVVIRHASALDRFMAAAFVSIGRTVASVLRVFAGIARSTEKDERHRDGMLPAEAAAQRPSGPAFALPPALLARRNWNERRAGIAAGNHRSCVWMIYLLSAFAVAAAVMGMLASAKGAQEHGLAGVWPMLETGFLAAIIFLLSWHRRSRWHKRWLGHRFLAEQLRYLAVTRPFLALPDCYAQPLLRVDLTSGALTLHSAEAWLLRRLLATEGIEPDAVDGRARNAAADSLTTRLCREIQGQIDYHDGNSERLEQREKGLRFVMLLIFWLAVTVAGAHFFDAVHHQHWFEYTVLLTTAGPALAAGLHGISTKLEYGRIASASKQTAQQLTELRREIEEEEERGRACAAAFAGAVVSKESSIVLRLNAIEAARIMSSENEQWRALVNEQRAEVPA
ncbi:DUF4231 domain-containing protein [Noviherbaspirillum pedocola]|uniref:SMODS and SLOG-associating 2TM effector domain-containing protein n=1 Tax=Noviherbaspirillum pedocola TaxID=2801341 RepID=A0A934SYK7_9BURK|nr:DUF4231 domain-containing protein [Noviherbaspirillum pedocola]MBK4735287.1 hypothetical protein [Noviherbaspirillum pedocola]